MIRIIDIKFPKISGVEDNESVSIKIMSRAKCENFLCLQDLVKLYNGREKHVDVVEMWHSDAKEQDKINNHSTNNKNSDALGQLLEEANIPSDIIAGAKNNWRVFPVGGVYAGDYVGLPVAMSFLKWMELGSKKYCWALMDIYFRYFNIITSAKQRSEDCLLADFSMITPILSENNNQISVEDWAINLDMVVKLSWGTTEADWNKKHENLVEKGFYIKDFASPMEGMIYTGLIQRSLLLISKDIPFEDCKRRLTKERDKIVKLLRNRYGYRGKLVVE